VVVMLTSVRSDVAVTASSSIDATDEGVASPFCSTRGENNQPGCDIILQQRQVVLPLPCMALNCVARHCLALRVIA